MACGKRVQAEGILKQAQASPIQVAMSRDNRNSARSQSEVANAKTREQASVLRSLFVASPITGKVTTRIREVGEVVTAGSPILEAVDS